MQFKNPKFGNIWRSDNRLVIKRSTGGELLTVVDLDWPRVDSFTMSFVALSLVERDSFLAFFIGSTGQEITFTDHEGKIWNGIIDSDKVQVVNNGNCKYEMGFSFRGTFAIP